MDFSHFTHGRRNNLYIPEEKDKPTVFHPFLPMPPSLSPSSSTAIVPRWPDSISAPPEAVEKEHMFEKVVTPSDVGKLNRLVIPKQHAERYFPLDSSAHDKGLLLSFEDRTGKLWRFRYSYWNSSQSYVMTKGWSRFVKEKRLDAGDTVAFGRGVGEAARDRLFIDWKRRPEPHLYHPNLPFSTPWAAGRLFLSRAPPPVPNTTNYHFLRSPAAPLPHPSPEPEPIVLSKSPVTHGGSSSSKRVRLFGVNLDPPGDSEDFTDRSGMLQLQLQLRAPIPELLHGDSKSSPAASSCSSSSMGGKDVHPTPPMLDLDI
ncbi:hypothetical protein HPP92_007360 [Vanilla planifolia]|uniref:TF-B3 domain-containing protein n=1 Tax=Vanilla planifolia TaxID=51239 RepID=A0A835RGG9_VANPL|nr:hypothetical protein HPP92_007360 [Vanilla planifolia]